jgi:hypothetical protein
MGMVEKATVARAREGAAELATVADATNSKAAVSMDVRLLSRPVPGSATILGPARGLPRAASGLLSSSSGHH